MVYFELLLRAAGVTLLLMQTGLLLRDARHVRTAQFGIALALSLACVMATDTAAGLRPPREVMILLTPISMFSAVFVWWFSQSLFDDEFRIAPWQIAVAVIWGVFGFANYIDFVNNQPFSQQWAIYSRSFMAVAFVAHIVFLAIGERKNDLVERRRQVRTYFALTIMTVFLMDLTTEHFFGMENVPLLSSVIQHGTYTIIVIWTVFWLGRIEKNELLFERTPPAPAAPPQEGLSVKETVLKEKLVQTIEEGKAYLEPELSITALAERIGAPEHQLRLLINKAMGHRNFRSFLNQYRLADAKVVLANREAAATPILTIAMDSGFASLSSFNRAFKTDTGLTPTAYREQALSNDTPHQN